MPLHWARISHKLTENYQKKYGQSLGNECVPWVRIKDRIPAEIPRLEASPMWTKVHLYPSFWLEILAPKEYLEFFSMLIE
jgi:hypothetical protein